MLMMLLALVSISLMMRLALAGVKLMILVGILTMLSGLPGRVTKLFGL